MNTSKPEPAGPDRIGTESFLDVLDVLRRRWWVVMLAAVISVSIAAVYYSVIRKPLCTAELVVTDRNYEIAFIENARSPYSVWQHRQLGEETGLLSRVTARVREERLMADPHEADIERLLAFGERDSRNARIEVSVGMPTPAAAVRVLKIWAEEYRSLLPRYRAAKLLQDIEANDRAARPARLRRDLAIKGLTAELETIAPADQQQNSRARALRDKLMDLEVDRLAENLSNGFDANLARALQHIRSGELTVSEDTVAAVTVTNAIETARAMVREDLNRVISEPVSKPDPMGLPARLAGVFLTSLIFAGVIVVFSDWVRSESPEPRRAAKTL